MGVVGVIMAAYKRLAIIMDGPSGGDGGLGRSAVVVPFNGGRVIVIMGRTARSSPEVVRPGALVLTLPNTPCFLPQIQIGSTSKQYVACRAYSKRSTPVDRSDGYLYVFNDSSTQTAG